MHSLVISVSEGGGCFSDPSRYCTQDTLWGQKKYHSPFFRLPLPPIHSSHKQQTHTYSRRRRVGDPLRLFHYFSLAPSKNFATAATVCRFFLRILVLSRRNFISHCFFHLYTVVVVSKLTGTEPIFCTICFSIITANCGMGYIIIMFSSGKGKINYIYI